VFYFSNARNNIVRCYNASDDNTPKDMEAAKSLRCVDSSNITLDSHFACQNDICAISTNGAYMIKLFFSMKISFMCEILCFCNSLVMQ